MRIFSTYNNGWWQGIVFYHITEWPTKQMTRSRRNGLAKRFGLNILFSAEASFKSPAKKRHPPPPAFLFCKEKCMQERPTRLKKKKRGNVSGHCVCVLVFGVERLVRFECQKKWGGNQVDFMPKHFHTVCICRIYGLIFRFYFVCVCFDKDVGFN